MTPFSVSVTKSAQKEFEKLPSRIKERIADVLRLIAINPFSELLHVKKIKGEASLYRARTGDYRVVYHIQKSTIRVLVIKIGHRKDVYRDL